MHLVSPPDNVATVQLLILQATPFCNIACKYCYLPNRSSSAQMSESVMEAAVRFVFDNELGGNQLSIVWHAGEPLAVPPRFYERAVDVIRKAAGGRAEISHSIQTNATTINAHWCKIIKQYGFKLGVSLDGPQFIHDKSRVDRKGIGTFDRTMRGVRLLQEHGIDFHVIAVLTRESLKHAEQIREFFRSIGVRRVGFNIEEIEGENTSSSIGHSEEPSYLNFLRQFPTTTSTTGEPALEVRELTHMGHALGNMVRGRAPTRAQESTPFAILTVDTEGNLSTFSPELIGNTGGRYDDFIFGNVLEDSLSDVLHRQAYIDAAADIRHGVERCASECEYYKVCGGGAPSNKLYENGTFRSTRTFQCRYKTQLVADEMLRRLESAVGDIRE